MKAFVTGSTGLLGNNLVRLLLEQGHEVKGLARDPDKAKRLLGDTSMQVVVGDMKNVAGFASELEGCDWVFHTAAYFREYYQPGDHSQSLYEINIKGTLNLMNEADRRGVRRFVHTSSSGTIGRKPDGSPGDESTPPMEMQRKNGYFNSKVEGDKEIANWRGERGMEVVEILPGWMWGPGDAAPTAAGQLALDFLNRKLPGYFGGGTVLVDARDVAAAMIAAAERGGAGEKYIVGGRYIEMDELVKELEKASGVAGPKMRIPHPVIMTFAAVQEMYGKMTGNPVLITREGIRTMAARAAVTSAKAERELGATFRPIHDTLRDVIAWYRTHGYAPQTVGKAAEATV